MHIQRNELGKNRAAGNGISDTLSKVKQKGQAETAWKNDRNKVTEESFQDSLQRSMNAELPAEPKSGGGHEGRAEFAARPDNAVIPYAEPGFGKGKAEGIGIHVERENAANAAGMVKEVAVRRLSYGECDKVEVNVLEGYTLKAKLEEGGERDLTGGCSIYVEMKDEEGMMKACLFDGAGLREDSRSAMERIAYAVLNGLN